MPKFKNPNYRHFLDGDTIQTIPIHKFRLFLDAVDGKRGGKYLNEARALVILLYYTGCRPGEALNMYQGDVYEATQTYIACSIPTLKHGRKRVIYLRKDRPYIEEMYNYCWNLFPKLRLFIHFHGIYKRKYKKRNGEVVEYIENSHKLRWYFKKWSENVIEGGFPPYYLRHMRMTMLSESGVSPHELRHFKGAKRLEGVEPYLHVSKERAQKIADLNK